MTKSISAEALHDALTDGGEIALLDVREEGVFAKRHILRACPMALSRLEIMVAKLAPRRSARIVPCDAGDGLSARAAAYERRNNGLTHKKDRLDVGAPRCARGRRCRESMDGDLDIGL